MAEFPRGGEIERSLPKRSSEDGAKGAEVSKGKGKGKDKDKGKRHEKRWSEMKRTRQPLVAAAKEQAQVKAKAKKAKVQAQRKRKLSEGEESGVRQEGAHEKDEVDEEELGSSSALGVLPKKARVLSFKALSQGAAVLAVVKSVHAHDAVLALPNNLLGYVRATDVSDVYTALLRKDAEAAPALSTVLRPGQWVRAVVTALRTAPRHRVELSLRESVVNASLSAASVESGQLVQGSVQSREERGYVVSLGLAKVTAFVPLVHAHPDSEPPWSRGSVRWFIVHSLQRTDEHVTLTLSAESQRVHQSALSAQSALGVAQLLPGTLVKARVRAVLRNGLALRFNDVFSGTVDVFHLDDLGQSLDYAALSETYAVDARVKARVMYLDVSRKVVTLTLRPAALRLSAPTFSARIGAVMEEARITRIDFGIGLALQLELGQGGVEAAYAHVSRVSDSPVEQLSSQFKVGERVRARVLDYALADELVSVTLRPSQISQPLLSYSDVPLGSVLSVTVVRVAKRGAVVALTDKLRGFVPASHLAELRVLDAQQRVHVGQTLRVRVLALDLGRHRVLLTAKKALVDSSLPALSLWSQCVPGSTGDGYIVSVQDFGLIVALWGDVKGLVPLHELGTRVADPRSAFSAGAVVRVRVLSCVPDQKQLTLSLRLGAALTPKMRAQREEAYAHVTLGTELKVRVTLVTPRGLEVEVELQEPQDPKSATTSKKRRKSGSDLNLSPKPEEQKEVLLGFVPLSHLSDDPSSASAALAQVRLGSELLALLLRRKSVECARPLTLSLKPALRCAARLGLVPLVRSDLRAGTCVWGTVSQLTPYGAFVHFAGRTKGLVHLSVLSDAYTKDPKERVAIGQTVCAYVLATHHHELQGHEHKEEDDNEDEDEDEGEEAATVPSPKARSSSSVTADLALAPVLVPLSDLGHAQTAAELVSALGALHDEAAKKASKGATKRALQSLERGALVQGRVTQSEDMGLVLALDEPLAALTGFVPRAHLPASSRPKMGERVSARVLDVDAHKAIVDLSLLPSLLSPPPSKDLKSAMSVGSEVECEVLLVHAPWAIVRIGPHIVRSLAVHVNELSVAARIAVPRLPLQSKVQARVLSSSPLVVSLVPPKPEREIRALSAPLSMPMSSTSTSQSSVVVNSVSELRAGMVVDALVRDVFQTHLVALIGHVKATLHISELDDDQDAALPLPGSLVPPPLTRHPLARYTPGMTLRARILRIDQGGRAKKALPLAQQRSGKSSSQSQSQSQQRVELSVRRSILKEDEDEAETLRRAAEERPPWGSTALRKGAKVTGWVHAVGAEGLWVHVSSDVRARVFLLDCHSELSVLRALPQHFPPGQAVRGVVTRVDAESKELDVSLRALVDVTSAAPNTLKVGAIVPARVSRVVLGEGVFVQLFAHTLARIHLCDLEDTFSTDVLAHWQLRAQERALVLVHVLAVTRDAQGHSRIDVSARASRVDSSGAVASALPPIEREVVLAREVSAGALVQGYVRAIDAKTCFVSLARHVVARVFVSNLSDRFVRHPTRRFPVGSAVRGRVLSVRDEDKEDKDKEGGERRIELSLKPSALAPRISFEEVKQGAVLTGRVKTIRDFGVFVTLDGSALVGLAHVSECHDDFVRDLSTLQKLYSPGDRVRALVLRKNPGKKQLSLSLKPSHFKHLASDLEVAQEEEEEEEEDDSSDDKDNEDKEGEGDSKETEERSADDAQLAADDSDQDDEDDQDEEENEDAMEVDSDNDDKVKVPRRKRARPSEDSESQGDDGGGSAPKRARTQSQREEGLSAGSLDWGKALGLGTKEGKKGAKDENEEDDKEDDESSSFELEDDKGKGKGKGKEDTKDKSKTTKSAVDSASSSSGGVGGSMSAEDFERALLATPHASALWIAYMAHYVSRSLVEKARDVAERALQRIDSSLEDEKRNVFVALLHLEHDFGDALRLQAALTRALQYCEPKAIYSAAIEMHAKTHKEDARVDALCKSLLSKHGKDVSVWLLRARLLLERNVSDSDLRALLSRALAALAPRKHVRAIAKLAHLAYKHSRLDLARALLEDVLATYAKRVDLWGLYLDQEERLGLENATRVRALYERVTALKVPLRKMKALFKRWLRFEQSIGDEARIEHVKDKAQSFVAKEQQRKGEDDE